MNVFLIVLIVLIVVGIIIYIKFRKPKKATLLCYSGTLGGGKTFNGTLDALKFYRKSIRHWKWINRSIFNYLPFIRKRHEQNECYGLEKPCLYSNYPIKISKGVYSEKIDNDVMFLRKTIPLNSVVIIDEFSSWISQFEFNETYSDTLNDHIQKWRHYHGNLSHLIVIDQCTNNIPIQVRYRLNESIICLETRHYFKFIHITKYKCIQLADDIKSVEILDNDASDTDDKVLKLIRFSLSRKYDDRAYSNRYTFVDSNKSNYKFIDSPMKALFSIKKPMPKEKYPVLDIEIKKQLDKLALKDKDCQN